MSQVHTLLVNSKRYSAVGLMFQNSRLAYEISVAMSYEGKLIIKTNILSSCVSFALHSYLTMNRVIILDMIQFVCSATEIAIFET